MGIPTHSGGLGHLYSSKDQAASPLPRSVGARSNLAYKPPSPKESCFRTQQAFKAELSSLFSVEKHFPSRDSKLPIGKANKRDQRKQLVVLGPKECHPFCFRPYPAGYLQRERGCSAQRTELITCRGVWKIGLGRLSALQPEVARESHAERNIQPRSQPFPKQLNY